MITAVIIGHNEGEHVQKMHSILSQYPDMKRIWILDRCTDDTEDKLRSLGETFHKTPETLEGRQTSFCRNLGASMADKNSDILFLDGDRYPVLGDLSTLNNADHDVTLLMLENDHRGDISVVFWKRRNYGHVNNMFYSCGVLIKRSALDKITSFQDGKVFSEEVQDVWGVEDLLLGDVCYHLGLSATFDKSIRLHGRFEKLEYDSFDPMEIRFQHRQYLKVHW